MTNINNFKGENGSSLGEKSEVNGKKVSISFLKGLLDFLKEYSVIGLAIGVIIGQASRDLVDSLVKGLFMPFIELLISKDRFESLILTFRGVDFDFGKVVSSSLTFLIIMILLYFVVKKVMKSDKLLPKNKS